MWMIYTSLEGMSSRILWYFFARPVSKTSRLLKYAHLPCYPHPFLCPPRDRLLLGLLDHLQKTKAFDLVQ